MGGTFCPLFCVGLGVMEALPLDSRLPDIGFFGELGANPPASNSSPLSILSLEQVPATFGGTIEAPNGRNLLPPYERTV